MAIKPLSSSPAARAAPSSSGQTREDTSDSSAQNAANIAAAMQNISVESGMSARENRNIPMLVQSTMPEAKPASGPMAQLTKRKSIQHNNTISSASGRRADQSCTPKTA